MIERFLTSIVQIATQHQLNINDQRPMVGVDWQKHRSDQCHICKKPIADGKVRDHCHMCGKYRGPAHNECNMGYKIGRDLVVIFHNLRRYDGHLLMEKLGTIAELQGYKIDTDS